MKWIVIEENPKPDDYIAIMVTDDIQKLQIEEKAHSVFHTGDEAMRRAKELKKCFGVKATRIFQWESHSVAFPRSKASENQRTD